MFGFRRVVTKVLATCLALFLGVIPVLPKGNAETVPPGNWNAVELLQKGTSISLRMTSGDRMEGKFHALEAEGIRLIVDGQERILPKSGVAEIRQLHVGDSKVNGTIYGMLAGGAVGGIAAGTLGELMANEGQAGQGALYLLAGIGIGALVGLTVDSAIKGDRLLYRK